MNAAERKFFPENERLFLQKDIDRLFGSGQSFISYPLRIVFLQNVCHHASEAGISVLVSVPKKRIRLAVKRNRIKRLIRESYRLNKNETVACCKQQGKQFHIAFIYIDNDVMKYANIEKAVLKSLKTIFITDTR